MIDDLRDLNQIRLLQDLEMAAEVAVRQIATFLEVGERESCRMAPVFDAG